MAVLVCWGHHRQCFPAALSVENSPCRKTAATAGLLSQGMQKELPLCGSSFFCKARSCASDQFHLSNAKETQANF